MDSKHEGKKESSGRVAAKQIASLEVRAGQRLALARPVDRALCEGSTVYMSEKECGDTIPSCRLSK
ncbi:hypothetical protein T439DRAFT_324053 [Meredithblackwellia eburnea MCA 4105]